MRLSIGIGRYDRTQALLDGRIGIDGIEATFESPSPEELFVRAFDRGEFDVAELSFSNYLYLASTGRCDYVGLPIFPSRMFRHSAIFIRSDRGIQGPRDLAGRMIGVREFSMTAGLVARGILEDEYGFSTASAHWVYGRAEADDKPPTIRMSPRGITAIPIGSDENLSTLLAEGRIDALIAYKPPSCFLDGMSNVRRLFPDHEAVERDYYSRTGIFPIMHLLAVKRTLADARPELCGLLCNAFDSAKNEAYHALEQYSTLAASLPWTPEHLRKTRALMGEDFWSYGIEPNQAAIAAVIRYSARQGLSARPLSINEIFEPSTLDWKPSHQTPPSHSGR